MLAALALTAAGTGCGARHDAAAGACSGGDILLISVDTLRADHLSLYGYGRPTSPNLARWFSGGHAAIYERAYSTHASTPPSVVSLLTGRLPQEHGVRLFYQLAPEATEVLPQLLPACYQSAAFVSNMVLTREAMGLGDRFDHFDDLVHQREPRRKIFERDAERTTDAALAWLAAHRDPGRPLLLWVHYMDPHGPYLPPPPWREAFSHGEPRPIDLQRVPDYERYPGVTDGLVYVDRYDGEIAFADAQVGRLLAGYARLHPVDDALLIFTADHGETMMDHEKWFTHGFQVHEEIVRIPLLVRGPGVAQGRRREVVSAVDIAPTLLRWAGAEVPEGLSAVDLRSGEGLAAGRTVFTEASLDGYQWRAAVQGSGKWVVAVTPERRLSSRRYFDLAADPGEADPRPWPEGEVGDRLLDLVRRDPDPGGIPTRFRRGERLAGPKIAPPQIAPRADEEVLERLRALGYVGSPAQRPPP